MRFTDPNSNPTRLHPSTDSGIRSLFFGWLLMGLFVQLWPALRQWSWSPCGSTGGWRIHRRISFEKETIALLFGPSRDQHRTLDPSSPVLKGFPGGSESATPLGGATGGAFPNQRNKHKKHIDRGTTYRNKLFKLTIKTLLQLLICFLTLS